MNRTLVRAGAMAALLASVLLGSAASALASCVMPPSIDESIRNTDAVFVGTVVTVANSNRWATVAVEDVWKGPDLPGLVEVRGGSDPGTASSIDRQYTAGTKYLFFASVDGRTLADNSCSSTTSWTDDLAQFRPPTARPPVSDREPVTAGGFDLLSFVLPAAVVAGAGVMIFGMAFAARKRS